MRRRFLVASGAGVAGAVVGVNGTGVAVAASAPGDDWIDLREDPYNVKANVDDVTTALANASGINKAIIDHAGGGRLLLPAGAVFVARDLTGPAPHRFAAIRIFGNTERLVLSGRGAAGTRLVMTGTQHGGLSQIIKVADGARRITLCDFSIEHGPGVSNPDPDLQNHQIEVKSEFDDVTDVEIRDIFFGTNIGDAIRLIGGDPFTQRGTTIRNIIMRLDEHPAPGRRCRSGISFQKGIRDVLLTDFHIVGPKNSPLDMEPTSEGGLDNITITNGTLDNSEGDTFIAASFGGFEDKTTHVTHFITNSRMVNVRIKRGQLRVLSSKGCTLDNLVIDSAGPHADGPDKPLLFVSRENEDLTISNVDLLRDVGSPAGPLVGITHTPNTRPKRINIHGGTWMTKVGPGSDAAYVNIQDTAGLRMRGTRIRIEDALTGTRFGVKFRPFAVNMTNLHLDGVAIEAPDNLTAGFVFAAINRNITNITLTGCSLTGATPAAIAFEASGGGVADRFPVFQGNDFERAANLFTTVNTSVNAVFPVIAGNRGSVCTLTGPVAPEGVVAARQGSQYIRQNGDSPELWWKATGTGATGWLRQIP